MAVPVSVTQAGVTAGDARALDASRAAFSDRHAVHLPGLLAPTLLSAAQRALESADFSPVVGGFYAETRLGPGPLWHHLLFLINDPAMFRLVEVMTGCDPIGCFMGRVYRRGADGHFDDWHDDAIQDRMIGMSINLGAESFDGGALRLRERASQRVVYDRANTVPGDAVVFRISEDLQHIVTPVEGQGSRTAFAGWFKRAPDFRDTMLRQATAGISGPGSEPAALPLRLRPASTVAFHGLDDELLVHCLATDRFARLDPISRRIWELVYERQAVRDVPAALAAQYDVTAADAAHETSRVLRELVALGLLEAA